MVRNTIVRRLAVTAVLAVAVATTGAVPSGATATPPELVVVSPRNATQVAGSTEIAVEVAVTGRLHGPVRITLHTGGEQRRIRPTRVTRDRVTATIPIGEIAEGLSALQASAPGPNRTSVDGWSFFSYEPRIDVSDADRCEVLGQPRCLLPFPSNRWTRPDPTAATGRRIAFAPDALPRNTAGVHVDPTEWNRNDGFSPGSALVVHVPGVDLARSNLPTIDDMGAYARPDAGVVVVDTVTGERWPVWAELDAWATSDETRTLIIRPAKNFLEGRRYAVALRNLRDASGAPIPPAREFEVIRDGIWTFIPAVNARAMSMAQTFRDLEEAGIARSELYLAWDFRVASERNLSERVLRMRDDAFAQIGGTGAPRFTVTSVQDDVSASVWRRVRGTISVPLYLTGTGAPGSRINYGPDGLPARNGTYAAEYVCNIPRSVYPGTGDSVQPGRGLVYGHGLLGSKEEVNAFGDLGNAHRFVGCAVDWIGMSAADVPNVLAILQDLSRFPTLADRAQQSFVNFQFLARAMKHPRGFVSHPAFRAGTSSRPVIATGEVFFNGNSQGGVMGGAATAISTEWTRAALGVPGMNYSTLLTRSIHWDTFSPPMFASYPDEIDRTVGYTLIQMLWDRAETNGYAQHLTDDPLPNTPAHDVLLIEAFGDHQVANVATETMARTIGARIWSPPLAPGRTDLAKPFFGLSPVPSVPYRDSVLVVWDFGTPAPPRQNLPPRPPQYGTDPHGRGRNEPRIAQQVSDFLRPGGSFTDRCGGGPCRSGA